MFLITVGEDRKARRRQKEATAIVRVCIKMYRASVQRKATYRYDATTHKVDAASIGDYSGAVSGKITDN